MRKEGYDLLYLDPNTHHGQFNRAPNWAKSYDNKSILTSEYGKSSHGLPHLELLLDFNPKSWLDVGCGYNTLINFSCPAADQVCDVLDLPFLDKRWDLVTAFDVMEHIYPENVDKALQEMRRVSKRFAYTICYKKAQLEHKGLNAHATIMSREDWHKKIEENGGDIHDIESSKFRSSHREVEFFAGEWR